VVLSRQPHQTHAGVLQRQGPRLGPASVRDADDGRVTNPVATRPRCPGRGWHDRPARGGDAAFGGDLMHDLDVDAGTEAVA